MVGIDEELKNKTNTVKSLEQRQKRNEDLAKKLEEQRKLEDNMSTAEKVLFNTIRKSKRHRGIWVDITISISKKNR